MDNRFTEQDSTHLAEAARDRIIGEIEPNEGADRLIVCPLLTAGALANPDHERGGVACLKEGCAFFDSYEYKCSISSIAWQTGLTNEFVEMIHMLLRLRR